ncbi:MAG: ABC transporter ATP-binding protein [Gemmatimonadota bacterium]
MADAVVADRLRKAFGDFVAVDDLSFSVGTGEVFGFLGPNGAGKTTAIRMLTGLLPPTGGTAVVAGLDVARDPFGVRRRIGYMSQLFSLYGDLTVSENLEFFGGLYQVPRDQFRARRDWVIESADLAAVVGQLTGTLPLGLKQRLALGCALLHQPAVLFLDEPTSGVDPLSRRAFWDLIYELAAAGTTVLVSTHYMEEAEYCDRLILMHRGKLVALDTAIGLRARMSRPLLAVVTDQAPQVVQALADADGVGEVTMFGRSVHAVVPDISRGRAAVVERLTRAGLGWSTIEPIEPSLEDVFIGLVREGETGGP